MTKSFTQIAIGSGDLLFTPVIITEDLSMLLICDNTEEHSEILGKAKKSGITGFEQMRDLMSELNGAITTIAFKDKEACDSLIHQINHCKYGK